MRSFAARGMTVTTIALLFAAVACGSDNNDGNPTATLSSPTAGATASGAISATLTEYTIQLASAPTAAGDTTFHVSNIGGTTHELVVLQTDLAADALPTKADGSADEEGTGVVNIGETDDMDAGTTKDLTVDLQPGHYVLICNVVQTVNGQTVSHYKEKMYTEFDVSQ